jgi:predicted RNase H-like HicB family nuclease
MMSRSYDVVIERENGYFRATLLNLPRVSTEADTRDEALQQLQEIATNYLRQVELTTIELDAPAAAMRPGSPQAVLNAIAACKLDVQNEFYQEYLANLAEEKRRQRAEAVEEFETSAELRP